MKTRYFTAIAAAALALAGCQRESLVPELGTPYDGIVKFAPGVAGIGSGSAVGVRSGLTDGSAVIGSESLTLRSADGRFTIPMSLTVTGAQAADVTSGAPTKSTLINENGDITTASDFATAISSTFWVAAWSNDATPVQIIPDAYARDEDEDGNPEDHGFLAGGYVSANKEYQKVVYRTEDAGGEALATPYWMTVQPGSAAPDDEYKWKKNEAEKTFYAYANVPAGATVAQLYNEGTLKQTLTLTCTGVPTQDILMGYYEGNGSTGAPEKQTGTARIQFHHPFAAVKFKTGTLASGVTISGVAIEKIYGKVGEGDDGKLMVTQKGHSFTWTRADGDAFKEENLLPEFVATCDGEAALVIPQSFPSDSKARIRVTLQQDDETFNVYTALSGSWSAGYVYTYTIEYNPLPEELLPGKFSISPTEYVQFSRGNLFCTDKGSDANPRYSFAFEQNQYDYRCRNGKTFDKAVIGGIEGLTPSSTSGLFEWIPRGSAYAADDWGAFSRHTGSISGNATSDELDFGKVFPDDDWTTFTSAEWQYLLENHQNKIVTVNGVKGLCIAPDNYPETISDLYSSATTPTWEEAETAGMVFLPYYGYYNPDWEVGDKIFTHETGYWSSTSNKSGNDNAKNWAQAIKFSKSETGIITVNKVPEGRWRIYGQNVRLVQRFPKPLGAVKIGDLYWATENLAVTASGKKEWKGSGSTHPTGHIIGDYFQYAASYGGYKLEGESAKVENLVVYSSFTHQCCGDGSYSVAFRDVLQFNLESSPYYEGSAYTKYSSSTKTTLELTDDVANLVLGGNWRMPTEEEYAKMIELTKWTWVNDDKGFYVTEKGVELLSDKSNALLFFPASGYVDFKNFGNPNSDAYGFSSTVGEDVKKCYRMHCNYSNNPDINADGWRKTGFPIRPVKDVE